MTDHLLHPGIPALLAADERFGLTRSLAEQPASSADLAQRLGLDARAVSLVLDGLSALGRCRRAPDGVWTSSLPVSWPWGGVDAFLRTGVLAVDLDDPTIRDRAYATAVVELAERETAISHALAAQLSPAARVLDVGAGAGPWSLAQAERHPGTRVTALDRAEVLPRFLEAAARRGLAGRVDVWAGSWDDPLPEPGFDRVILANVLHLVSAAEAERLVARVAPLLRPGGELLVIDCLPRPDGLDALTCATYALHLGLRTRRGGVHPTEAVRRWCRAAGLRRTRILRPGHEPGLGALRAW